MSKTYFMEYYLFERDVYKCLLIILRDVSCKWRDVKCEQSFYFVLEIPSDHFLTHTHVTRN